MVDKDKFKAVPRSRLSRLGRIAKMAGGVATGMLGEGVRQLSQGNRPKISDLILTPANAKRVAKQLSAMRGAAMKVGQLLSMESNDILPPELADILAQLRDRAFVMPRSQLDGAIFDAYGEAGVSGFKRFDYTPIAAASIGQVHRATTTKGEEIVLKIQYPGVAESIDSDVDNIATLLKISNLLPKHMQIDGLLNDAKKQLRDEADYFQEAAYLKQFHSHLSEDDNFIVPRYFEEFSNQSILAMDYVEGEPIDSISNIDPSEKDRLMSQLFSLMFRELFELRLMQTDANFANYQYQRSTNKIVLLDFGATRPFNKRFSINYKRLIRAVRAQDDEALIKAADLLGYDASNASAKYQAILLQIFYIALEPFAANGPYDFAQGNITLRLKELTEDVYDFKEFWRTPPTDILYLHRKLGGMYLLATRLEARVDCAKIVEPWLKRLN